MKIRMFDKVCAAHVVTLLFKKEKCDWLRCLSFVNFVEEQEVFTVMNSVCDISGVLVCVI